MVYVGHIKYFALTEEAFTLAKQNVEAGWLIWIDADTYFKKRLTKEDILFMLPEGADMVYNSADPYFVAFNLNKQPPLDLLGDLREAYTSGEYMYSTESGMTSFYNRKIIKYLF